MFKGLTISDAVHKWVSEFNSYPQDMIEQLMQDNPEDWEEVTFSTIGDSVYVYDESTEGEIVKRKGDVYTIRLDGNHIEIECYEEDFETIRYEHLPMWGTLWSFGDNLDNYWLDNEGGIRIMSSCGFRIYEHREWGYFFGIDGAGYDFYDAHWIPLYKARGLHWHDDEMKNQ